MDLDASNDFFTCNRYRYIFAYWLPQDCLNQNLYKMTVEVSSGSWMDVAFTQGSCMLDL